MDKLALLHALELAMPGFVASEVVVPQLQEQHAEYKPIYWLDTLLGPDFICYVEWKEFDPWGLNDLNALRPVKQAGISLSTDTLYDAQGYPVKPITREQYLYDAGDFFLPVLQQQLAVAGLQLHEVGLLQPKGKIYLHENPRFVCTVNNQSLVAELNTLLEAEGLVLCA